jgi:nicotinamidase/pyrazinamidase
MINKKTDAILVVDLQNDFITGSLAVPGAEDIIEKVRYYVEKFSYRFFSKDYHPADHSSFAEQGGPWPPHCVEGTEGAKIHERLADLAINEIPKGMDRDKEQYSAFDGTGMAKGLEQLGIERLFICGLATDYCVKATVLDALQQFNGEVFIYVDAIAAVNVKDGDGHAAIQEMVDAGAKMFATHR